MKTFLLLMPLFACSSLFAQQEPLKESDLRRILRKDPQNIDAYVDLIKIAETSNIASQVATEAINNVGSKSVIYTELGNTYMRLEDFNSAVSAYQQSLALNPLSTTAYNRLGLALLKINYYRQAEVAFKAAASLSRNNASKALYLTNLALVFENLKLYKDAKETLDIALSLNPQYNLAIQTQNRIRTIAPQYFQ